MVLVWLVFVGKWLKTFPKGVFFWLPFGYLTNVVLMIVWILELDFREGVGLLALGKFLNLPLRGAVPPC